MSFLAVARRPAEGDARPEVVATTAMMGAAIQAVAGDDIRVRVLIPGGSCPGHYDLRPGDMRSLERSAALFLHGYEPFAPRLLDAGKQAGPRVHRIRAAGNWMVPETFLCATEEVARALVAVDPTHAAAYRARAGAAATRIRQVAREAKAQSRRAGLAGKAVLCSDQQADLLKWLGLRAAGTYGRPEEFTPPRLHALARTAEARKVRLVVDNLQSGPEAGLPMARQLGAAHVTLSNFPGGFPGTDTWELCFRDNLKRLLEAASGRKP